jgi:phosphatidylserine/phosphatidylglycerophosphate/cardiolipin synthase-like enzyme
MPSFVIKPVARLRGAARAASLRATVVAARLIPRTCILRPYTKRAVRSVLVKDQIIAYASPDSTFAVTKRLLDAARRSILIGIYDFTADHAKELLLAALRRGVQVELMLDLDGRAEQDLFDELARFGAACAPAPSCASKRSRYFRSSHEKVVVIDNEWSMVQSGNFSTNSIPLNVEDGGDPAHFTTGNRDMGLAVRSTRLAAFFRRILESDIRLELSGPRAVAAFEAAADAFLVEAAPRKIPEQLFPSQTFALTKPLKALPVLSPDNYMNVVPPLLEKAKESIFIEQQYIKATQSEIAKLLSAIKRARAARPGLDVRIVLGKIFSRADLPKERANLRELKSRYGLELGRHIRYINTDRFVHCHNKMVLIDGDGVLVSSQNWSNAAVSENREAGLWLRHRDLSAYLKRIFESDWRTAVQDPGGQQPEAIRTAALRSGQFIRVMAGDYV